MISGRKWDRDKVTKETLEYMQETWLNKLCAMALTALGSIPMFLDNNASCLVIMLPITVSLFFSRKNWIG